MNEQQSEKLNEHHRRRLLVSCQYVDRLLTSIESALAESSPGAFPRYVLDLTAEERAEIRNRVAGLRARLLTFLKRRNIVQFRASRCGEHSL